MNIVDIEIPYVKNRSKRYRFFEALPGLLSWLVLMLPFIISFLSVGLATFLIIGYILIWLTKVIGLNIRVLQGWKMMQHYQKLDWPLLLGELESGKVGETYADRPKWHYDNLLRVSVQPSRVKPSELLHSFIIAFSNEGYETLQPTLETLIKSRYDLRKVILVLAYEQRCGPATKKLAERLVSEYQQYFKATLTVEHPSDIPGEMIAKGSNTTYAARALNRYVQKEGIDPLKLIVTTLDSDNRPHNLYLPALSYMYSVCPEPRYISFQPIPVFNNNIWDAPAPMRVIATGNSLWQIVVAMRQHILRNFSAHAQSMQTLVDTDYWSRRTIVEDGHQFWRTYFRYDGRHEVYPIFLPVYQDAVLAGTLRQTLKAQFIQLRRWAWGASDVAYVLEKGYFTKNKLPKLDLTFKFLRLLEGHISWATAPLVLAFAGFIPALFGPDNLAANQLFQMASNLQRIALLGIVVTLYLSFKSLPPKPLRYKRRRNIAMVAQWMYMPITSIVYNSFAALNSQTRLIFGWYLGKFDVTEKAVITDENTIKK